MTDFPWFESTAKIVYDPRRPGMKRRTEWWCIATVDREITRYYREWIKRERLNLHDIVHPGDRQTVERFVQPAWDAHISVIRGEKPKPELMHLWRKHEGEIVTFRYEHNPRRSKRDDYWTVTVDCPELVDIRKELERPFNWPLHLSVGRENTALYKTDEDEV